MPEVLLISDNHGLVRPEVEPLLAEADAVLHAGDVGSAESLSRFRALNGNIHFVRGNVDGGPNVRELPEALDIELFGKRFHMLHDVGGFREEDAVAADFVIFGHSHKPEHFRRNGVDFINPGSIGPRRFKLPVSYALLSITDGDWSLQFHTIDA